MPYDYYEPKLVDEPINVALNAAIERAAAGKAELPHPYLGASIVGSDCLRRVQYDWWCRPEISARTRAIFARGHYFEARVREQLVAAGLTFAPPQVLAFTAVNGDLRGHVDGVVIAGPNPLGSAYVNFPFIWENKALNSKNWRALGVERHPEEQQFTAVDVNGAEQQRIGQIEIGLIERNLRGITGEFLLESVARERAPVLRIERLVLPNEWKIDVGTAERVGAGDNDAVNMATQIAVHSRECERLGRRKREAHGD